MGRKIVRILAGLLLLSSAAAAADVGGIWVGQNRNQRGEPDDVAFRFKVVGQVLTGTLFGDEFDLPITEGSVSGDQVRFTVTTTNYYSKRTMKFAYTGTVRGNELELVRERVLSPDDTQSNRPQAKQTLKLKRLI